MTELRAAHPRSEFVAALTKALRVHGFYVVGGAWHGERTEQLAGLIDASLYNAGFRAALATPPEPPTVPCCSVCGVPIAEHPDTDACALAVPPEPLTGLPPLLRSEAPFRVEWTEDGTIPRIVNREGNFAVEHDIVDFLNSLATPEADRD